MEENRIDIKTRILYILMFVLTGVLVWGFSFLTGKSYEIILRNTVVALLISGIIIFMLEDAISRGKDGFSYDNYYHKNRFAVIYLFVLVLSCLFALISNLLWPYMAIIVILGLFSNNEIGIASGIGFVGEDTHQPQLHGREILRWGCPPFPRSHQGLSGGMGGEE